MASPQGLHPPSGQLPPRLALPRTGPNAGEYGASDGYPIGDRSTFYRVPFLVGSSKSSRSVLRESGDSPSRHAVTAHPRTPEPASATSTRARRSRSTSTSRAIRPPDCSSLAATRSWSSATSTGGTTTPVHLVVDGQDGHRHAGRHRNRGGPDPFGRRSAARTYRRCRHRVRTHLDPASAPDVLGRPLRRRLFGSGRFSAALRSRRFARSALAAWRR